MAAVVAATAETWLIKDLRNYKMMLRKLFSGVPVTALLTMALATGGLTLTGCDVDVQEPGPLEEVTDSDGLEVEVD